MAADKKNRVQVWVTHETRQKLRVIAAKEDRELIDTMTLIIEIIEFLQNEGKTDYISLIKIKEDLRAAIMPPSDQPTNTQDA